MLSKSCSYCRLRGQDRRYLNGENENLESHCLAKVALTSFLKNPTPDFLDGVNNSLIASKTRLAQCDSAIFFSLSRWPFTQHYLFVKVSLNCTLHSFLFLLLQFRTRTNKWSEKTRQARGGEGGVTTTLRHRCLA